jgi:quercetin dioxygenase-like cupin family protein
MGRTIAIAVLWGSFWLVPALAAEPRVTLPDELHWVSPPWDAAVHAAWILGSEQATGPYLLRVRIEPGGKIPPHTHPDERYTTVLSGSLHVSFGPDFDSAPALVLPTGTVYVVPANQPHRIWAEDGEVVYQEAGHGSTATNFLNP